MCLFDVILIIKGINFDFKLLIFIISHSYSMFYSSASKTFPEDIECVLDPNNGKGGIFISNV